MDFLEKQKGTNRLTSIQKIILSIINDTELLSSLELPDEISFDTINVEKNKVYNNIHKQIDTIFEKNGIEPHEIYNLIKTYDGNNENFYLLKKFIICRNLCILKKAYNTEQWKKNINKITSNFKQHYDKIDSDILNEIVFDILINNIILFDITQYKLILDSKNNIKSITIDLEDQKYIISRLLEKGYVKK
jgi:hypothetical protein